MRDGINVKVRNAKASEMNSLDKSGHALTAEIGIND